MDIIPIRMCQKPNESSKLRNVRSFEGSQTSLRVCLLWKNNAMGLLTQLLQSATCIEQPAKFTYIILILAFEGH